MYTNYDSSGEYVQLETSDFSLSGSGNDLFFTNLRACFQVVNQTHPGKRVKFPSFSNNTITLIVNEQNDYVSAKLPPEVDFNNQLFIIRNGQTNNLFLFEWSNQPTELSHKISKSDIDSGKFNHIDELKDGMALLTVTDNHFWTYYTGATPSSKYRKDILLVNQGEALNSPVFPYSTNGSYQTCRYCPTNNTLKIFKNIKVLRKREQNANFVTNLLKVEYQNNVQIENVFVGFEDGYGECVYTADQCFKIDDSTNILFKNINVFGTYSNYSAHGYAFYLNNIWNCKFENVVAFGNWGVFGCNNINKFQFYHCSLNRVDIHLYGMDIFCKDCYFSAATRSRLNDMYDEITYKPSSALTILQYPNSNYPDDTSARFNRFDNLYGQLIYDNCVFDDFIPLRVDDDFHIYTGFDLIIMGGEIIVSNNDRALAQIGKLDNNSSNRPENRAKEWPNIFVDGTKLKRRTGVSDNLTYSIFHVFGSTNYSGSVGYITFLKLMFSSDSDFSHFCIREVDSSGIPNVAAFNYIQRQLPVEIVETTYGNEGVGKYVKIINQ